MHMMHWWAAAAVHALPLFIHIAAFNASGNPAAASAAPDV
jgi:hypothetical protein